MVVNAGAGPELDSVDDADADADAELDADVVVVVVVVLVEIGVTAVAPQLIPLRWDDGLGGLDWDGYGHGGAGAGG